MGLDFVFGVAVGMLTIKVLDKLFPTWLD